MTVKVRSWQDGWYVVVHYKGKRFTQKCESEAQAYEVAEITEGRLKAQGLRSLEAFSKKKKSSRSFEAYANRWMKLAEKSQRKPSTVDRYRQCFENHLLPEFKGFRLEDLSYSTLKEFCIEKARSGLSRDSVRLIIATLRLILKEAVREGLLPNNPASGLGEFYGSKRTRAKVDPETGDESKADPFSPEELTAILNKAAELYPIWYPMILVAARTGLRFGEIRGLQWSDIDFRNRRVMVRRNWPAGGAVTTPKTRSSARTVDLSGLSVDALRRLQTKRKADCLAEGIEVPEWVFLSRELKPIHYRNFIRRVWDKVQEKAEVRRRNFHELRHSYASHLLMAGADPIYVSRQLGHSQITTTLNVYTHWIESRDRRREVDLLEVDQEKAGEQ